VPGCNPLYWTSRRYSRQVLESLDQALNKAKADTAARKLLLIGYSGGGALAMLLAAQRRDVDAVITVAANLDHRAWTAHHGDTPLHGSLNAADFARRLQSVPQVHYAGEKDKRVPVSVILSYLERMDDRSRTMIEEVSDYDHECCWAEAWPRLLANARRLIETLKSAGNSVTAY
jgi:dienelactone hydrolase